MQWLGLTIALSAIIYCEFLADFFKLYQCSWPNLHTTGKSDSDGALHAMILADTHLLGPFRGHWLDKLYREWHMHRAFQATMTLLQPEIIFVLGDLFDEGEHVGQSDFNAYVKRFHRQFQTPTGTPLVSAVGNHDVGFHYKLNNYVTARFEQHFNNTGVNLYTFKGLHFVFINSMAMENDGCPFCELAMHQLHNISHKLNCLRNAANCANDEILLAHKQTKFNRPILLQHFPTYRISDKVCKETDAPVIERYRENWEVLSKESTKLLGKLLHPRLVFAGHSHNYCFNINHLGIKEYTVASFSWRNKVNPSFLLATFTATQFAVTKCDMLHQQTVYNVYILSILICISLLLFKMYSKFCKRKKKLAQL